MSTRCPAPPHPLPELQQGDVAPWADYLLRIYSSRGASATSWAAFRHVGPLPRMRIDHHRGAAARQDTRGILYASGGWLGPEGTMADPLEVAVLERFGDTGVLDRATNSPRYALWRPTRTLRLLRLTDSTWLARAGGNAALTAGARPVARAWSRRIYDAYPDVDGLLWSSSVRPAGRSVALYERAVDSMPSAPDSDRALSEPFLQPALARIAATYALTLV